VTEIRALICILLFLGAVKFFKGSTAIILAKDGNGNLSSDKSEAFFASCVCLRFDGSATRAQRRADDKLAPIRYIYDKFVAACEAN
jgi:hypothetical protein